MTDSLTGSTSNCIDIDRKRKSPLEVVKSFWSTHRIIHLQRRAFSFRPLSAIAGVASTPIALNGNWILRSVTFSANLSCVENCIFPVLKKRRAKFQSKTAMEGRRSSDIGWGAWSVPGPFLLEHYKFIKLSHIIYFRIWRRLPFIRPRAG